MADGNGQTVVLGWDGLDVELVEEYGLTESFGPHYERIETFDNPVLGTPHTHELWPSIVTGLGPDEHGIHAATEEGGVDWDSSLIGGASRIAQHVVPDSIRTEIGRILRNRGAQLDFNYGDYYREHDISTVFDGRAARPIAIPNYRTELDDELDLVFDRGAQLGDFLNIREIDGKNKHVPEVPLDLLEQRLFAEANKKLGIVRACIQREYDIVFVWLGLLDTVGHLAPVVFDDDPGWQERWYRTAAKLTREVRSDVLEADTLVCLSDHGLQNGDHTHETFVGANSSTFVEDVDSVLDVRDALDRITPSSGTDATPEIRSAYRYDSSLRERDVSDVRESLEDLGYI